MKNFINVRVERVQNEKIINRIKHNTRYKKSLNQKLDKPNLILDIKNNKVKYINNEKQEYKNLKKILDTDIQEHKLKYHNSTNRKTLRGGTWGEGVITFSEKFNVDFMKKYDIKDLSKITKEFLKNFENSFDTEIKTVFFHLDETTPHFHFFYKNFDSEGKSITYKNKNKKKLSELQDLVYKSFKKLGMERGINKDITHKNNQTTKKYYDKKYIEMKEVIEETKELIEENKELIEDLKNQYNKILKRILTYINRYNNSKNDIVKKEKNKKLIIDNYKKLKEHNIKKSTKIIIETQTNLTL